MTFIKCYKLLQSLSLGKNVCFYLSPNLRQVLFWKPVLEPGFHEWGKAVLWISIFLLWHIILFSFFIFFIFFESLKSKSTQMLRPQKVNLGVSFNDTLLNFGLCMSKQSIEAYTILCLPKITCNNHKK